ncbi:hypothetical protein SVA_3560 [Sulfurifustis variabilis]|uniref:Cell shape determination protein CcmA n=1 Tax=Sulfurifustis variabilis TaxID=1675686 RepID=A0A1C7AFI7_9GAMM|nr:polymer-forming cytoskeletal protein [Sulfurifustis variabilis]BAU50096.1 hypothetical protein SVA_3560 [Sulfurifustis variabilis]
MGLGSLLGIKRKRRTLDRVEFETVIGIDALYRGDINGTGTYAVHGAVEGACALDGHLLVAGTARWVGDIDATHVVIAGEVVGDVSAREKLELLPTARIRGHITSPVIAMAEGAIYEGEIRMRPRPELVHFSEKRSS